MSLAGGSNLKRLILSSHRSNSSNWDSMTAKATSLLWFKLSSLVTRHFRCFAKLNSGLKGMNVTKPKGNAKAPVSTDEITLALVNFSTKQERKPLP